MVANVLVTLDVFFKQQLFANVYGRRLASLGLSPLILSGLLKNLTVLPAPMVIVSPAKNRTSPRASSAGSKRKRTPRKRQRRPRDRRRVPAFVLSENMDEE